MATILAVDDSTILLEAVSEALSHHDVVTCEDPAQVPVHLLARDFDLMLLDVDMPTLTGPDLLTAIRSLGIGEALRVVLYSGKAPDVLAEAAAACGAMGSIPKGVPIGEVVQAVEAYLSGPKPLRTETLVISTGERALELEPLLLGLGLQASFKPGLGADRAIRTSSAPLVVIDVAAFSNGAARVARMRRRGTFEGRKVLVIGEASGEVCLDPAQLSTATCGEAVRRLLG